MFNKVRMKFITLSMTALFVLLFVIIAGMNVLNYKAIISEADTLLSMVSENEGKFPPMAGKKLPPYMSKETPYETRYFSVVMNGNKEVVEADTSRISSVDSQKAQEYAIATMESERERGFIEEYRYVSDTEDGMHRITFLDMGKRMYSFQAFMKISILMGVCGYLCFLGVIIFFSGRIMKPVAESYEKQKRFITDAGHELKTPLAIINADVDVLTMDMEGNEWLEDIQTQVKRLAGLTNDLVYLSRIEEAEESLQMVEFSFSDAVKETTSSFYALAKTQNKNLQCTIPPMLSMVGNEKSIRQLVNILMDNALKYSPEEGLILVDVQKQGGNLLLSVFNTTQVSIPKEKLDMIFERFYRIDPSRSSMTGGYGIGLSIAKAIVDAHNGKISADATGESSLKIEVTLPNKGI